MNIMKPVIFQDKGKKKKKKEEESIEEVVETLEETEEETEEDDEEEEEVSFDNMTKKQLIEWAESNGYQIIKSQTKAQIIESIYEKE